jgi:hypothetical protein
MSNSNLKVELYPRKDIDGNTYYVGKLRFNGNITFKDGMTFLIFVSDKGNEQLQLAPMDSKDD